MNTEQRLDKLTEHVQELCVGQERLRSEIEELRRGLAPLAFITVNCENHKVRIKNLEKVDNRWKLAATISAFIAAGLAAISQKWF